LNAWLEAYSDYSEVASGADYRSQEGRQPTGYSNRSGFPCEPLPRIEQRRERLSDGTKRRIKRRVNQPKAVFLEEGDSWGSKFWNRLSITKAKYLSVVEESERSRKAAGKPLRQVEKGAYKGPVWSAAMSKERAVQGFEDWGRPPTLIDLVLHHHQAIRRTCPIVTQQYEYKSSIEVYDATSGIPLKRTEVVNWKVRDGSHLGPTVYDDVPLSKGNVCEEAAVVLQDEPVIQEVPYKVEMVGETLVSSANAFKKPYYDDGTSIEHLSQYATPIQQEVTLKEKLETGSEYVSYTSLSRKEEVRVSVTERTKLQVPDHPTEKFWFEVDQRRWTYNHANRKVYPKAIFSDKSRYLHWLVIHDVHNGGRTNGQSLVGSTMEKLLLNTIGIRGVHSVLSDNKYQSLDDESRHDAWFEHFGDLELAKSLSCVHPRKRLIVVDQDVNPEVVPINIVAHIDYEKVDEEYKEPISKVELDQFFETVSSRYRGGLTPEALEEYKLRHGMMNQKDKAVLLDSFRRDPNTELYVPDNMPIITANREDSLNRHIEIVESIHLNSELFADFTEPMRRRREQEKPSLWDKVKSAFS